MRTSYEAARADQIEIQRTLVQGDARLCSRYFGMAWKGMFPHKTAEELASRAGCSVRAAAYELSGEREPSFDSIVATLQLWKRR
jgi:transcriptional regulator with XRE-family HTH domain